MKESACYQLCLGQVSFLHKFITWINSKMLYPKLVMNCHFHKLIFYRELSNTKFFRYDKCEPIHLLILQSIYSRLMGGPLSCPSLGSHWIDVGFNHTDPSVDLTSAKMIGAVSLLYFITEYSALADEGMF